MISMPSEGWLNLLCKHRYPDIIGRAKRAPHCGVQSRFRVIYNYIYICVSVVCQITWNHVNQTRACSKSVLGCKIRPVTPVLFILSILYTLEQL